eukprot:Phypoly_transcript_03065.p1 GENE.Phypoly_transcript_03065~~Phypoly_transcript_03065.p1  ORF type:complete len:783 (+),score=72.05 Phypoly_transcript_03065:28-2376(+)
MRQWLHWALRCLVGLVVAYFLISFYLLPRLPDEEDFKIVQHGLFNISVLDQNGCAVGGSWGDVNGDLNPALLTSDCKKSSLIYTNKDVRLFETSHTFLGSSVGSCWGDVNNDGWDDVLLMGQEEDRLYINNKGALEPMEDFYHPIAYGNGLFCIFTDLNRDGRLDIIRINKFHELFILENVIVKKKPLTFIDVTSQANVPSKVSAFVGVAQDVMIFISLLGTLHFYDFGTVPYANITNEFVGFPSQIKSAIIHDMDNDFGFDVICLMHNSPPVIAFNDRNYSFVPLILPEFTDVRDKYEPIGLTIFDLDNNMLPDIFVAIETQTSSLFFAYINTGNSFQLIKIGETDSISGNKTKSNSLQNVAISDFNLDGYVDVALFDTKILIFANNHPTQSHNWIELDLIVIESDTLNGVQVGVTANNISQMQIIQGSQNSHKRLHFGLGSATVVSHIFIKWKVFTQSFFGYQHNQIVTILSPFAYKYKHALQVLGSRPQAELQCNPGAIRLKPSFLILGIYKSGTTSLSSTLARHPQIVSGSCKEIHYFDEVHTQVPIEWYWGQFPCSYENFITFEATAGYLIFESAPPLVYKHLPDAKFIVLLRDPVDRMYSHFNMITGAHWEGPEKFDEEARKHIGKFMSCIQRQQAEINTTCTASNYTNVSGLNCTEIKAARACAGSGTKWTPFYAGLYFFGISRWFKYFPRDRFMFIDYPDLIGNNYNSVIRDIEAFLGIEITPLEIVPSNISPKRESMLPSTREYLTSVYKPYNELVYELLKIDYGWSRPKNKS